jgi:flavin reductase
MPVPVARVETRASRSGRPVGAPARGDAVVGNAHLRSCLSRFGTGVCVVTVAGEDGDHGLTVNSFTAVSMDPPLVLVSVDRRARGHELLAGRPFAVNVLAAEHELAARHFAGDPHPEAIHFERGSIAPNLAGMLAVLQCKPWRAYDGGDHTLYLGEVVEFEYRGGDALGYFYSRFATLEEPSLGVEHIFG